MAPACGEGDAGLGSAGGGLAHVHVSRMMLPFQAEARQGCVVRSRPCGTHGFASSP
jgi:hypothetical protein